MSSSAFSFEPAIVSAVLHHMNDDHADDNLLIARAFGDRSATMARMVAVDGHAGHWVYTVAAAGESGATKGETALRVEWSGAITERAEIRREIVVLYDRACTELGIEPRPHD
ncbi:DUF2470 domain-containing protein [Microcella sp.]|uniref:DUF2470 domain-containing protein n=1 Tax=Microcella sp. TaxID=1913979 RepID=UPI0025FFB76B|nr:DUF2470 domain-containing protein [Microcella sp.]